MREVPENFIIPTQYGQANNGVANVNAYSGQAAGRPFKFDVIKVRNAKLSEERGLEVEDSVEIVEFINDEKSSCALRIDPSLFQSHPEILADYEKWKSGKQSGITDVKEWTAISHVELGMLIARGFQSVEQIFESPDEKLQTLGLIWKDIKNKAKLHMNTKNKERGIISETEEFTNLKIEAEASRARSEQMEAEMIKMREQLEALMAGKTPEPAKPVVTKKPASKVAGVQS
jgi:hypothetical protein